MTLPAALRLTLTLGAQQFIPYSLISRKAGLALPDISGLRRLQEQQDPNYTALLKQILPY